MASWATNYFNNSREYLVNAIDLVGDVLKTAHEQIEPLLLDTFERVLGFLGLGARFLKLLVRLVQFVAG